MHYIIKYLLLTIESIIISLLAFGFALMALSVDDNKYYNLEPTEEELISRNIIASFIALIAFIYVIIGEFNREIIKYLYL